MLKKAEREDLARSQDIYGGNNPRDVAAYTVAEAARYVRIPPQTLRAWVAGQSYARHSGRLPFHPLITAPQDAPIRLSFNNVIEAYTLRALRTKHKVSIAAARQAMDEAERSCQTQRLLLCPELRTGAGELFLEKYGNLVDLTKAGQIAMKHMLDDHLARIELDELHIPIRLYPADTGTKVIVMDPRVAFGRPIIARRGISTAAIVDRINVGETEEEVAEDYGLELQEVKEALVYDQAA